MVAYTRNDDMPCCSSTIRAAHVDVSIKDSSPPTTGALSAAVVLSRFRHLRSKVIELNQRGIELYLLEKYQSSLFHFNEAFRLLTSRGNDLLNCTTGSEELLNAAGQLERSSLFGQKPLPPNEFMRPLGLTSNGAPRSMADIEAWILIASMTLMINGAFGHFARDKADNAEQLLLMAVALSEDDEEHDSEEFECLRRQYHVKMVLMSVYFVLGQVQSKAHKVSTNDENDKTESSGSSENTLTDGQIRECMESFTECLTIADDLLGSNHLTVASVYVTIGQVLLREGYMQGASVSFRHAEQIYNTPRPSSCSSSDVQHNSSAMSQMSDLEVASMLLAQGWSYGAPVA
jgi:hypothetical protein